MDDLRREREELIVIRCRLGEEEAFRELVETMEERLFYYVRKFIDNDQSAMEVLQEVWMAIFKQIHKLEDAKLLRPWIYKIAHNKAVSRFREERVEPSCSAEEIDDLSKGTIEPDWDSLDAGIVHKALDKLSALHREVLMLYFIEEMDYGEIASATGVSLGVVKSRIHYAKKNMRAEIERLQGGTNERREQESW
jgi:RNA polymerase sigma-70 factor, ECF subfamily